MVMSESIFDELIKGSLYLTLIGKYAGEQSRLYQLFIYPSSVCDWSALFFWRKHFDTLHFVILIFFMM